MTQLHTTMVDRLIRRASEHPSRTAFTFLREHGQEEVSLSYGELDARARALAVRLMRQGLQGERALILLPSGLEYITAVFGCFYAGVVVVPGFPVNPGRSGRREAWFTTIAADASPAAAFTAGDAGPLLALNTEEIDPADAGEWRRPSELDGDSLAVLQYTSGSTSTPKGVMVTHGNIVHNQRIIQHAYGEAEASTIVGWLPLHHDMGLMGTVMQPVYSGARAVLMGPTRFLQAPVRWLSAISRYSARSSSAPNFAYDLCSRRITEEQKAGLDLSCWQVAVTGAEPVRWETMSRFAAAFACCGFRMEAFRPAFGLAESTLMVTTVAAGRAVTISRLSASLLETGVASEAQAGVPARVLVGCGGPYLGHEVRIVDSKSNVECPEGHVGEVWVRGDSVARGYWKREEETARMFRSQLSSGEGPFLRTGDLGLIAQGELFLTGRLKDLILIRGRNIYPQDIEIAVQQSSPCLRRDCGAAFTVEVEGEERLIIVNEVDRHCEHSLEDLTASIRAAVALDHGVQVHCVALVPAGAVPKTTSGKIQRSACRAQFLENRLELLFTSALAPADSDGTASPLMETEPGLRTELVEAYLRRAIADLLGIASSSIGTRQSLAALGADSLAALELSSRIEKRFSVRIGAHTILQSPGIAHLGDSIVASAAANSQSGESSSVEENTPYPLSAGQLGLWIHNQTAPESPVYNLASAAIAKSAVDPAALGRAFFDVLSKHRMLRSVFTLHDGEPVQITIPLPAIAKEKHYRCIDLASDSPQLLRKELSSEAARPFRLSEEPPVRLTMYRQPSSLVLLLTVHHIVADLWSMSIILRDLGRAYTSVLSGPADSTAYLDSVRRQEAAANDSALWEYWRSRLTQPFPLLALPAARPRPATPSYEGASQTFVLGRNLRDALEALARANDTTLFTVLFAAYQVLLHRICGQQDLIVGTPVSGRDDFRTHDAVGYFVNILPVRSDYDGRTGFTRWLASTRGALFDAFQHQALPFTLMVEKLAQERDRSAAPIFQTLFAWQSVPGGSPPELAAISTGAGGFALDLGELKLESVEIDIQSSQFDITLMLADTGSEILGTWKYSTDLLDAETVRRNTGYFSRILEAIIADPQCPICFLPLIDADERNQLIGEWSSQPAATEPSGRCVHELFEEQAARTPVAPAVTAGEVTLTYAELNAFANQFARVLKTMGVGIESRVAICLNRSVELIAAILGVWKAGAAYVPLDPRDPPARLAGILESCAVQGLVTHEQLVPVLPSQMPPCILLDLDLDLIALEERGNLGEAVPPGALAYVIHTSGSTGQPKGVMVGHRPLSRLLDSLRDAVYDSFGSPLKIGLNAPVVFDSSVKQLITLAMGHALHIVPDDVRRNGHALLRFLQSTRLDVMDCTPTQAQMLIEAGLTSTPNPVSLLLGGEAVPAGLWHALAAHGPGRAYNLYGPTECTVDATACRVESAGGSMLGRPLSGARVYVLDENMEPTPKGVPGELFIGGEMVARGYLRRPDLTAERFLPDPFHPTPGSRMYRTGDSAYFGLDSNLHFIGRVDRQVKLRGFRIELGEVEAALRAHPNVADAVAVVAPETGQLVAYIVEREPMASTQEYRRAVAQRLPEYMTPSIVMPLPRIPLTVNGKRDYNALPAAKMQDTGPREDFLAPRNEIEESLAELWKQALRVEPVGVRDNFFELGGDSLQATRLLGRIQEQFTTDEPLLASFFQEPTIEAIANAIARSAQLQRS